MKKLQAWLNNNPILGLSATLGAGVFIFGTLWSFADEYGFRPALIGELHKVMDQVQQNTNSINLARFLYLNAKREHATLSVEEAQERCQLAKALNWTSVEGCQ